MLTNKLEYDGKVISVAFSSDGATLASEGYRVDVEQISLSLILCFISQYQIEFDQIQKCVQFSIIQSFFITQKRVASLVFSSTTNLLVSGDIEKLIKIREIQKDQFKQLKGHSKEIKSISSHPKKNILASGSLDETIRLWDLTRKI